MKNRRILRSTALLLSLLFVLSLLFSCGTTPGGEQTDPESTAPATPAEFVFVENGVCKFSVIRPDADKAGTASVDGAVQIRTALEKYAAEVTINTDWIKSGQEHDASAAEILIGKTNYPQTAAFMAQVPVGGWGIHADGNKLVVYSADETALREAADNLVKILADHAVENGDGSYTVTVPAAELEQMTTPDRMASKIPPVEGASVRCFYNPGNYCDEIIYEKATPEIFQAYVDKLEAGDYYVMAKHDIAGNPFYLLDNYVYTINAGYYSDTKEIRLVVEESTPQSLYGLEEDNHYTAVTTTQLTMLGVGYTTNSGTRYNNGQSVLIRLCDGRFIVIDGAFNTTDHFNSLVGQMEQQSKDYRAAGEKITVAAWIISHPHGDHWGLLNGRIESLQARGVKVQTVMFNFISEEENEKYKVKQNTTETLDQRKLYNTARQLGADVVVPHVGSTYYIANLKMETLFTIESYGPNVINDFNGMCPIHKMTFTDPQSGEECVYMSLCDATGYDLRTAANTFGDYMKADISQIAHHGASTKGDDEGAKLGYSKISPALVLWTSTADSYKARATNDFLLNKRTNPSLLRVLDAGDVGKATIVPIPYTVGSETVVGK